MLELVNSKDLIAIAARFGFATGDALDAAEWIYRAFNNTVDPKKTVAIKHTCHTCIVLDNVSSDTLWLFIYNKSDSDLLKFTIINKKVIGQNDFWLETLSCRIRDDGVAMVSSCIREGAEGDKTKHYIPFAYEHWDKDGFREIEIGDWDNKERLHWWVVDATDIFVMEDISMS